MKYINNVKIFSFSCSNEEIWCSDIWFFTFIGCSTMQLDIQKVRGWLYILLLSTTHGLSLKVDWIGSSRRALILIRHGKTLDVVTCTQQVFFLLFHLFAWWKSWDSKKCIQINNVEVRRPFCKILFLVLDVSSTGIGSWWCLV